MGCTRGRVRQHAWLGMQVSSRGAQQPALLTELGARCFVFCACQVVETAVSIAIIRLGVSKFEPLPKDLFKYDFRCGSRHSPHHCRACVQHRWHAAAGAGRKRWGTSRHAFGCDGARPAAVPPQGGLLMPARLAAGWLAGCPGHCVPCSALRPTPPSHPTPRLPLLQCALQKAARLAAVGPAGRGAVARSRLRLCHAVRGAGHV